jgi:flagellin
MKLSFSSTAQSLRDVYNINKAAQKLNKAFEKSSSGQKNNSCSDDAAGLSLSDNVQRISELSVKAANDVNSSVERRAIVQEVNQRIKDIDIIADTTIFGSVKLLDGTASKFSIQEDVGSDPLLSSIAIGTSLKKTTNTSLDINGVPITAVDAVLSTLNATRGEVDSYKNGLNSNLNTSMNPVEDHSKSFSSIRDADMSQVSAEIVKQNILRDSTMSILAQGNTNKSVALKLLAA